MKLRAHGRARGTSLLEVVAYIAVFFIVSGLAYSLFLRREEQNRSLRRSADDITAAMSAGERWREDVRAAVSSPQVEAGGAMSISQRAGEVRYITRDGALWRETSGRSTRVLPNVQKSLFEKDARQHVTAWRCTVELRKRRQQGSITPLFTFTAVPEQGRGQ